LTELIKRVIVEIGVEDNKCHLCQRVRLYHIKEIQGDPKTTINRSCTFFNCSITQMNIYSRTLKRQRLFIWRQKWRPVDVFICFYIFVYCTGWQTETCSTYSLKDDDKTQYTANMQCKTKCKIITRVLYKDSE